MYTSASSGPPCGEPVKARCQCWEDAAIAPWNEIDYIASLPCDDAGQRLEVQYPASGSYFVGVHATPGNYPLAKHCPGGAGCGTCGVLIAVPK